MIALLRSTDGQPDSRFEKYVDFLNDEGIQNITLCWDRFGVKNETTNRYYYKKESKYGLRFGNVSNLLGFNRFLLKELIRHRKEYKVVHAADFDTILPAIIMKVFFRKKVIYDIYDWYIDSRGLFKSKLRYLIQVLEYVNIKLSDMVIICEDEREPQIMFKSRNLKTLPNIPNFKGRKPVLDAKADHRLKIAYVGILGSGRGLTNLIKLAGDNPEIDVEVAGFGPLEKEFVEADKRLQNLTFHGRMDYADALDMMAKADMIYAMYERVNPNQILAAPNKYYEGLYLGRPIVTTVGTLVGAKTLKFNTGYAVDENYESLQNLIDSTDSADLQNKAENARKLWNGKYRTYVADFLSKEYLPFILKNNKK